MLLYLVRHAEAKSEEEDPERGLTEKGLADIRTIASFIQKSGITISRIHHSGKKRAMQTAQVLADYLKPAQGAAEIDGIRPMDDPEVWAERVSSMAEDLMLIGHLPHVARLASLLLYGDADDCVLDFEPAGVACLKRFDDDRWTVEWMVVPRLLAP
jgi:phosphohistidine phosphatase